MIKVAINGFGRIGRCALRQISKRKDMEVVAINDLTDPLQLAYLYKYDSVHRMLDEKVASLDNGIEVNGKKIKVFSESDPSKLPWKDLKIDVVLECTGVFTTKEKSSLHINAGAKKVIISAPAKDECKTIVYGVNESILDKKDQVISSSSCTTNCLAPVLNLLHKCFIIESGSMITVHAMTNDQETLDIPHKKGIESRRGRAASLNIVPTSTGAASSIGKVIPELDGKLSGIAYRVPVGDGSLIDLTLNVKKKVTSSVINDMFKNNKSEVIKIVNIPLVSSDIIGSTEGALVDGLLTKVVEKENGSLIKVSAWYDNEWGYTAQMLRVTEYWCKKR